MKRKYFLPLLLCLALSLLGCKGTPSISTGFSAPSSGDRAAAIMVDGIVYLLPSTPSPAEVAPEAIIGSTTSYTDGTPARNGETNFDRELGTPYARVSDGIAILWQNEWYICRPMK